MPLSSPPAAPSAPLEHLPPAKRPTPDDQPRTKPVKKARLTVRADETTQVSSLSHHRFPFADADVYYVEDFIDRDLAQQWHDELLEIEGWYQPTLKMYGKEITQSRKIAAFATDRELTVKYSGALVDMRYEYPPLLRKIQDMVEDKLGVEFNHCMMNHYEDGSVYIGNHRDNRENRVIASLSLGAARTFIMEHDKPPPGAPPSAKKPVKTKPPSKLRGKNAESRSPELLPPSPQNVNDLDNNNDVDEGDMLYYKKWSLENGSLVVMQGDTQAKWKHQIPKELKVKQSRLCVVFYCGAQALASHAVGVARLHTFHPSAYWWKVVLKEHEREAGMVQEAMKTTMTTTTNNVLGSSSVDKRPRVDGTGDDDSDEQEEEEDSDEEEDEDFERGVVNFEPRSLDSQVHALVELFEPGSNVVARQDARSRGLIEHDVPWVSTRVGFSSNSRGE